MSDDQQQPHPADATQERLAAAKTRCEKATPGPWERGGPWPAVSVIVMVDGCCGGECPEPPLYEPICILHQYIPEIMLPVDPPQQAIDDADFIAHAREDLPLAMAEVERLRGELAEMTEAHDAAQTAMREAIAANVVLREIQQLVMSVRKEECNVPVFVVEFDRLYTGKYPSQILAMRKHFHQVALFYNDGRIIAGLPKPSGPEGK